MFRKLRRSLFAIRHQYDNVIDLHRARGLLFMNYLLIALSVVWLVVTAIPTLFNFDSPLTALASPAANLSALSVSAIVYALIQRGRIRAAAWIFVMIFLTAVPVTLATNQGLNNAGVLFVMVPIVVASAMLNRRAILLTGLVVTIIVILAAISQSLSVEVVEQTPAASALQDAVLTLTVVMLAGFFLYRFNGWTQIVAQESRDNLRVLERISAFIAKLEDKTESLALVDTLNFLRDELRYSFTQVFLTSGDGVTYRRIRTGVGARRTIGEETENVVINDGSALLEAVRSRKPVMVSLEDPPLRRAHFLPGTFDAVAVPVIYRNNIIGVLDVQSTSQEGFNEDEARVLNTLGDGLAAAIVNLRLITDLQTSVARQEAENTALRSRLQSLRQADRASRNVWERLVVSRNQTAANGPTRGAASSNAPLAYGFDFDGQQGVHLPASDLPSALRAVLETGAHQVRQEGDVKVISVPINLRGQLLGAMSFSVAKDRVLSDKQIETAKIVAERLALALENRQLFEQTQAQAERERKASEAASLFITSTDVESVMNVAVRSFNEALGAIHTRIHLQPSAVVETERGEEVGA